MSAPRLVVGFDLDMTLVDSRPGVRAVWQALAEETGTPIDVDLVVSRLGPPLDHELSAWFPADRVPDMARRYRSLYATRAVGPTKPMRGAHAALAAVRRHRGQSVLVTAKHRRHAQMHVDTLALDVDTVEGELWGTGKAAALARHGAQVYVGDHVLDVAGARAAGAVSAGVPSGPCTAAELSAAGADVVLEDLDAFGRWLDGFVLDQRLASSRTSCAGWDPCWWPSAAASTPRCCLPPPFAGWDREMSSQRRACRAARVR